MWYAKFNGSLSDYEVNGSNANNFHHYSKKELVGICRTQMLDDYKNPHFEKVDVACVKYTLYIKCALNGHKYAYDFYDLDAINPNDMDEDEYAELIDIRDRIKNNDSDVASASIDSIAIENLS